MPGDKLLLIEGMEAARLHPWESCKLAAQNADLAKTPAAGPTRKLAILEYYMGWLVGPNRRLAILESCSPGKLARLLLAES